MKLSIFRIFVLSFGASLATVLTIGILAPKAILEEGIINAVIWSLLLFLPSSVIAISVLRLSKIHIPIILLLISSIISSVLTSEVLMRSALYSTKSDISFIFLQFVSPALLVLAQCYLWRFFHVQKGRNRGNRDTQD